MRALFAVLLLSCGPPLAVVSAPSPDGLALWAHRDSATMDVGESRAWLMFTAQPDGGSPRGLTLQVALRVRSDAEVELRANGASLGRQVPVSTWTLQTEVTSAIRGVVEACLKSDAIVLEPYFGDAGIPSKAATVVLDGGQPQRMREVLESWKHFGGAW